MLSIEEF